MPSAACPKCSKTIEGAAGSATCDSCGATVQIPAPAESSPPNSPGTSASAPANSSAGSDFKAVATQASRIAGEKTKIAMGSTLVALAILVKNPTQGISEAYEKLGAQKALCAGIFCGIIFDMAMLVSARQYLWFYSNDVLFTLTFASYCKIFISASVMFISLAGTLFLCRLVGRGKGRWTSDVFVAGIALLPAAIVVLFSAIFGPNNFDLVLGLVAECLMVLILFHAFRDLSGLSPNFSAYAVPVALVISGYVAKALLGAMM
ncbi:MAG TPA: hypothetical protein VMG59_01375 [Phycisphaerae bacterium]|nr:hypothetical protein [Phycisphaerae bacterium]